MAQPALPMNEAAYLGLLVLALALLGSGSAGAQRIELQANEFTSTNYLTPDEQQAVRKDNILRGTGEADYAFEVPKDGWYEFWAEAAEWATDLYLDGQFLIHTPFTSGVWPKGGDAGWKPALPGKDVAKVLNLPLTAGRHTLRFSRPWFPGLPYLRRFVFVPAQDVTGLVRLSPLADRLVFRAGEPFRLRFAAGRQAQPVAITLCVTDVSSGELAKKLEVAVPGSAAIPGGPALPAGEGTFETTVEVPTDREGVFDIALTAPDGRAVDRVTQYAVVDTRHRPAPTAELHKELLATVDCAAQAPDYASPGGTRAVTAACGSYRESGPRGRVEDLEQADWFAYKLNLPTIQDPYLVEVDYPDDDQRAFLISVVEEAINPYAPTLGVACGGEFSLSNRMQTHVLVFYPRQKDPRLFLQPWYRGQRAAAGRIRVYRLGPDFPVLCPRQPGDRLFGLYQEECLRFPSYFGAMPEGNQWTTLLRPADRLGRWATYTGANLWHPTIAVYQSMMWPGKTIPGYAVSDEDSYGVIGPATLKEPLPKDIMRLMLLESEKYGLDFIGELHIPANWILKRELDKRCGGKGTYEDDGANKPWLNVSSDGKIGGYNPLYPVIQDWVASVFEELAKRYADSPAFKGLSIRLMGWQFSSWQTLPSIRWGYEDFTLALFEKETGVHVPVAHDDPQRFAHRYEWLMANAYEPWVSWRCQKIHAYHQRLAGILQAARPDLTLHLDCYGPTYDTVYSNDWGGRPYLEKGWLGLIRESGIDPALYRDDRNIVLNESRAYPPGIRSRLPLQQAEDRTVYYDPTPLQAMAKPAPGGTTTAMHFDAQSMEGEMVRADALGLPAKMLLHNKETAHGAGVLNPAGRHALSRYAEDMAEGNLVFIHDGSHGYAQGQPQYLREFLAEYRALPAIGMTRLAGSGDPVALWWGTADGKTVFYLVNRAQYAVTVQVELAQSAAVRRLSSGATVKLDPGRRLSLSLQPYQLVALETAAKGAVPIKLVTTVVDAIKQDLPRQIEFAAKLLSAEDPAETDHLVPFSIVDQQRAEAEVAHAREALTAGRFVSCRRHLMDQALVRVYEAKGAYPPGLFFRKAPPAPEGAWLPGALRRMAADEGEPRVVPADQMAAPLAGEQALQWPGGPLALQVEAPLPNRYRLACSYIVGVRHGKPSLTVDGKLVSGPDALASEDGTAAQLTVRPAVALAPGIHRVSVTPPKGETGALLWMQLQPVYRVLRACDWLVVGPFASGSEDRGHAGPGMEVAYGPEARRDLQQSYEGDRGQALRWTRPDSEAGYVNLHALTGAYNYRVSYAVTDLDSPDDRRAELRFGVDYWARIWLNGQVVFEQTGPHGPPVEGQYTVSLTLRRGHNELLIKTHAGSAGNGFWCAISDPGDLRVSPGPKTGDS